MSVAVVITGLTVVSFASLVGGVVDQGVVSGVVDQVVVNQGTDCQKPHLYYYCDALQ